jgi:hypothetical protein
MIKNRNKRIWNKFLKIIEVKLRLNYEIKNNKTFTKRLRIKIKNQKKKN